LKRKEFADSFGLVDGRPEAMMGPRQIDQVALFYEFSLERHVPATHLLRSIDRFVDLSDVRRHSGGKPPRRVGSGWTAASCVSLCRALATLDKAVEMKVNFYVAPSKDGLG
jgi:hypothetical protein